MNLNGSFLFVDGNGGSGNGKPKHPKLEILGEQLLNASIIAGIVAMATWVGEIPDLTAIAKAFGITFLFELRKYRKLR